MNGLPTTLAVGVKPLQALAEIRLAAETRAKAVKAQVNGMRHVSDSGQQATLDEQWLSREKMKWKQSTEDLPGPESADDQYADCRIKVSREIHPGVRVCIGPGELKIKDEHRGATFHYDVESGEVAGLHGIAAE